MKKKLIKFVECKSVPVFQLWSPGSTIFHRCSCGQELSYDTTGVKNHWSKYEIRTVALKTKNTAEWLAWIKRLEEKVKANRSLYQVSDWSE